MTSSANGHKAFIQQGTHLDTAPAATQVLGFAGHWKGSRKGFQILVSYPIIYRLCASLISDSSFSPGIRDDLMPSSNSAWDVGFFTYRKPWNLGNGKLYG